MNVYSHSELFWNAPHRLTSTRAVDPLGFDALREAVEPEVRRFRPIMLTAAAAVLALIPLAGEVFWAPMALAVGGVIAATVLTLTFLPALYALAFRVAMLTIREGQSVDKPGMKPMIKPALNATA